MKTELTRRIGGEMVRVEIGIGVMEAAARVEPEWVTILAAIQRGRHDLVREVITQGAMAAGREDVDEWFDRTVERCGVAPFVQLAFDAMSDAFAKAADGAERRRADDEEGGAFDVRRLISIGAAMGWTPAQVREASLSDFLAAAEGYLGKNGGGDGLTSEDVADLRSALEDGD